MTRRRSAAGVSRGAMERSVLSNAVLTPEYCEQVHARVREFTEYVAKGFSCVQREMAAQMCSSLGSSRQTRCPDGVRRVSCHCLTN